MKILSHEYEVKYMPLGWGEDVGVCGTCDVGTAVIKIATGLTPSREKETLLHEILHALYYEFALTDESTEEEIVSKLCQGLRAVFVDNPDIAKIVCAS